MVRTRDPSAAEPEARGLSQVQGQFKAELRS